MGYESQQNEGNGSFFYTIVDFVQGTRATQGGGLLNEIVLLAARNVGYEDMQDRKRLMFDMKRLSMQGSKNMFHKAAYLGNNLFEFNFLLARRIQRNQG